MTWRWFCARLAGLSSDSRFVSMLAHRQRQLAKERAALNAYEAAWR